MLPDYTPTRVVPACSLSLDPELAFAHLYASSLLAHKLPQVASLRHGVPSRTRRDI